MTEERFVEERAPRWDELADLLRRAQTRGAASLSGGEVRRLGSLYRATTTDLALARTLGLSERTQRHVNRLCVAAHDLVYSRRERGDGTRIGEFLASGFPSLVRRTWKWHAAAAAAAVASGLVAYFLMRHDPDLADRTFGAVFRERAERAAAAPEEARRYLGESFGLWAPAASWGIATHNILVAAIGFALGATFGVGTILFLFIQGAQLGGGFAVFDQVGVPEVLGTFVAAHGPFELTALFIASGAGMRLGASLLLPGRRSRAAAFRDAGLESVGLLLGVGCLLVVAGLLEAFLSPSDAPAPVKWAVGAATTAFLAWYFAAAGRSRGNAAAHPA